MHEYLHMTRYGCFFFVDAQYLGGRSSLQYSYSQLAPLGWYHSMIIVIPAVDPWVLRVNNLIIPKPSRCSVRGYQHTPSVFSMDTRSAITCGVPVSSACLLPMQLVIAGGGLVVVQNERRTLPSI
ncbi:hypothetical protein BD310DRAFT_913952 [Dichomitus squalens]|uniref:Uncharacterized protein n=1 Tax=Dichomitus squalens TaxID=114155 RepID=A0A4Q9QCM4_9APHY|nr:hypothetical protein BD310DRAFT_913952 [Dichomitus squalens]